MSPLQYSLISRILIRLHVCGAGDYCDLGGREVNRAWLRIMNELPVQLRQLTIGFGPRYAPRRLRYLDKKLWLLDQVLERTKRRSPGITITMGDWNLWPHKHKSRFELRVLNEPADPCIVMKRKERIESKGIICAQPSP